MLAVRGDLADINLRRPSGCPGMAKSRKVERWTSPHVHADHHRATAAAESIARAPNVQRVSHPLITLRHMRERVCDECGRVFRPSSRHFRCPACRAKDLCACGNEKQVKSATCASCRTDVGEANANWKGRCTRHKAGYVMVRAPDHPRASLRYVFEHILVAEELLGRYLVDGESVHHINGVRGDNRPENLELWTRPQPSGIRVSDAINWARQTYDRYVGAGTPPTVLTVSPEHPWRWRESNPRPSVLRRSFSERSRCEVSGPPPPPAAGGGPQSTEVSPQAR